MHEFIDEIQYFISGSNRGLATSELGDLAIKLFSISITAAYHISLNIQTNMAN